MKDDKKFKGKYRIPSARWAAWDYGSNAAYFVTICVANRSHDFGVIENGSMQLSPLGQSAQDCWNEIPAHFPFVELGAFVVMPDHVHGIIIINKPVETQNIASPRGGLASPRGGLASPRGGLASQRGGPKNRFGPQSKNLASIVRGYKIGVTKYARQHDIPFSWQARYHDRVIRDAEEYQRIHQYILANPYKWEDEEHYSR